MNLNDAALIPGKTSRIPRIERAKMSSMGPPTKSAPKKRRFSSSRASDLPWGKNHTSIILNSSSNKRSTSSRSTTDVDEDRIIVAITEGRGEARCEVGLAAINVSRPVLILCQTSDSQSYTNTLTKLNIFNPHLILYPTTFETGKGNRLIAEIRKRFPDKKLITVPRKSFNKANGLDRLHKICIQPAFPLLIMIKNRYYALAAASGLLTYLQDNMYIYYANQSIQLDYQASEGYTIIDIATADRLELVCSNQPAQANKYSSLFGIMNRCLTRVGTRNLRSIILQPLYDKQKIDERLDCVEELIKNPQVLLSIQGVLPKLSSVDQLLTLSTLVPEDPHRCSNRQLNYLLLLNSVVDTIQPLKEILTNVSQPFFVRLRETLERQDFDVIKKLLRETIHEEAYSAKGQQADQQRIWAIKPGLNGLLDLVRKTYSERIEDMREYIKKLGQKYDLPLTVANSNKKGFHIILTLNQNQKRHMKSSDLPDEFLQVFRLANSFTMKTAELVNLSTRIDDILTDLFSLSNLMIHHIIVKIKDYAALFYELVEGISYLDVLQSLAEASCASGWTRPKFDEYTDVTFGRHPLLDFLCQKKPISNPIAACEHYNFHIITGPNGAGKSIFIRQVMLLQIMAQAGCFVPAQTAIFKPADKMFARISNDDDMESNASSFVLEMTEVNYILTTMTNQSLIIIDELCRSTSVEEGTAVAMTICQELAKSRAYTFVTTHFTLLTKLADLYFNVKVWQLQTIPRGDPNNPKTIKLDFKFSLASGATTLRGYGIYMVRGIWPPEVIRHVDQLQERYTKKRQDPHFSTLDQRVRLRYNFNCKMQKLRLQKKVTLTNLNSHIEDYKREMEKIGGDVQYSSNLLQDFQRSDEASTGLDHSIFDASRVNEPSVEELSKLFLENLNETRASERCSSSLETENERVKGDSRIIFTPMATQDSSVISVSKAKERMLEVFTPDTKLDVSQSTSHYSCDFADLTQGFEPEILLTYDASQCSLNLTHDALNLDDDQKSQHDTIRNENKAQVPDYSPSLREQLFARPKSPPNLTAVSESPFVNTFARSLQDDSRKTSTPLMAEHARNFAAALSTPSIVYKKSDEVARVTTPRISFTVPRDAEGLDIASIAEDLESFAEEMVNEEISSGEDVNPKSVENNLRAPHVFPIVRIIQGPTFSSFEDDSQCLSQGSSTIIRPVVRNLQQKGTNNEEILNAESPEAAIEEENHTEKCYETAEKSVEYEDNFMIEAFNRLSDHDEITQMSAYECEEKAQEIIEARDQVEDNININTMIEAFNSLSNYKESNNQINNEPRFEENKSPNRSGEASKRNTIFYESNSDVEMSSSFSSNSEIHILDRRNEYKENERARNESINEEQNMEELQISQEMNKDNHKAETQLDVTEKTLNNLRNIQEEAIRGTGNRNVTVDTQSPNSTNMTDLPNKESYYRNEDVDKTVVQHIESVIGVTNQSFQEKVKANIHETESSYKHQDEIKSNGIASNNAEFINCDEDKTSDKDQLEHLKVLSNQTCEKVNLDKCAEDIYDTANSSVESTYSPLVPKTPDGKLDSSPDIYCTANSVHENSSLKNVQENLMEFKNNNCSMNHEGPEEIETVEALANEQDNDMLASGKARQNEFLLPISLHSRWRTSSIKSTNKSYDTDYERTTEKYPSDESYEDPIHVNETAKCLEEYPIELDAKVTKTEVSISAVEHFKDVMETCEVLVPAEATVTISTSDEVVQPFPEIDIDNGVELKGIENEATEGAAPFKNGSVASNATPSVTKYELSRNDVSSSNNNTEKTEEETIVITQFKRKVNTKPKQPLGKKSHYKRRVATKLDAGKQIKSTPDKSVFDSSNSAESKEKTGEITSVSDASKLRNLDGDFSSSSSGAKNKNVQNNSICSEQEDPLVERSVTNLSEASRKRNLDKVDTSSTPSTNKGTPNDNTGVTTQKKKKKKFNAPLKRPAAHPADENIAEVSSDSTPKNKSRSDSSSDIAKTKFDYPSKLSQKAIREAFLEQDKKFFTSSGSSAELARMWEERLKRPARPTPRQIQQTECLATIRKTNDGVEVIPAEKKKKRAYGIQKTFVGSSYSNSSVNMNIFSDQNAETFDQFIKSDKKDYKSFNFKFGRDGRDENNGNIFDFTQARAVSSEYTQNSQSWTFVRKRSDEFNTVSQLSTSTSFPAFMSSNKDFSLTPEGFYKQNKEDINTLLRKYK